MTITDLPLKINTPEAQQLSRDMQKILATPADYYSKVASSLRVALTELTFGNVGQVIGKADENRFIKRLKVHFWDDEEII